MIGRVISLIVGIVFIAIAVAVSTKLTDAIPQVEHGQAVCNSTLGRLGSILSGNMAQRCEQVNQTPTLIGYGNIMVIVSYTVGGFCLALGTVGMIQAARGRSVHV